MGDGVTVYKGNIDFLREGGQRTRDTLYAIWLHGGEDFRQLTLISTAIVNEKKRHQVIPAILRRLRQLERKRGRGMRHIPQERFKFHAALRKIELKRAL